MDPAVALGEFLDYVIRRLVDEPNQLQINHRFDESGNRHIFSIGVASQDVGKLIGRNGFTISSIRSLLTASATRANTKVTLKILDHEEEAVNLSQ